MHTLQGVLKSHNNPMPMRNIGGVEFGDATRDLMSAIVAVHSRQMLHLDIKPSNIVLLPADPTSRVHCKPRLALCDFGHAMTLTEAKATENRMVLQSMFWRAPEMFWGAIPTGAVDVWSLGVVLAQLWTWRHPEGHGEWLATPIFEPIEVDDQWSRMGHAD